MGVYSDSSSLPMFVRIAYNNLRVAFLLFVSGMFTGFGTGFALFVNGVMVGSFQTFMFQQGVGFESMLAIWLHGTFEISAFVTVGAGGFALGNGWLFPGTYSRGYAFRQGAKRGLKIVMSLVPIIIVAAFIESYFTRHTEYPNALRLAVILLSLGLMVWYYVVLPHRIKKRTQ